jgi:alkanesulfonate monooxygenase SsuD/methylene tetrahydromethanopterin reductase-like flavin-dependent oxidoreductase (luciferase family)
VVHERIRHHAQGVGERAQREICEAVGDGVVDGRLEQLRASPLVYRAGHVCNSLYICASIETMMPIDTDTVTVGYLLPTRDAITLGRPQTAPLLELAERAEALGFDAAWVGDSPLARARHDALLMLAAVAARTERIALGTAVLLPALRSPLLLAQAVATLDLLAGGRLILGLGAGFPLPETERQFVAVGEPYRGRVGRMVETVAAMRALWARPGQPCSVAGKHVVLDEVALEPPPSRAGGPPLWLAGAGERAERRVGEIADGWLPYIPDPEQYERSLDNVRAAAQRQARPTPTAGLYATVAVDESEQLARERLRRNIERYYNHPLELIASIQATFAGTPEAAAEWLAGYVRAGARHVVLRVADEDAERGLKAAGALRELLVGAREPVGSAS